MISRPLARSRDRIEVLAQALVELDQMHAGGRLAGKPLGQHPLAPADLEHDVVGLERRVGEDRVQQVRIGEEVLAQADHHQPNNLAALASIADSCSAGSAPRASATTAAVMTTLAGWLRLPRTGCGER